MALIHKLVLPTIVLFLANMAQASTLDLREISDRIGVEEAITTLFIKTDEKDWRAIQGVFASKVKFDMSSLTGATPATLSPQEITAIWEKGLKEIKAIHHQAGNFRIKFDGDGADAHCYGIAYHFKPNSTGRNTRVFVGSYDFHLNRSESGWKIDLLRYNSQFVDGNLKLDTAK